MSAVREFNLGRYLPGNSLLHRMDPRVKLLLVPLTVVTIFATTAWAQLVGLAGWVGLLLVLSGIGLRTHLQGLKFLRWLFLFTLVLHLLLSPGRTLFGVAWLSLDGLIHGLFVVLQLALALLLSALLTLTTPTTRLAVGLEKLLLPFKFLGLSRDSGGLLVWVLHFVPILREEAAMAFETSAAPTGRSLLARAERVRNLVVPLLIRLVGRADRLAHALAAGENPLGEETELGPLNAVDYLSICAGITIIAGLVWWI